MLLSNKVIVIGKIDLVDFRWYAIDWLLFPFVNIFAWCLTPLPEAHATSLGLWHRRHWSILIKSCSHLRQVKAASATATIRHIYRSGSLFWVVTDTLLSCRYALWRGTLFCIKFGKIKFLQQLSCLGSTYLLLVLNTLFLHFNRLLFR